MRKVRAQPVPRSDRIACALAALGAFAFGATDQYLGSLFSPMATTFSLMSAPWALLPFAAGCALRRPRAALFGGLLVTWSALIGYILMTVSPIEGVHLSPHALLASAVSQSPYLAVGLITGPLYGLLGYRWRITRSPMSAALVVAPVIGEPLIRRAADLAYRGDSSAYLLEVAAGVLMAVLFALSVRRFRRAASGTG